MLFQRSIVKTHLMRYVTDHKGWWSTTNMVIDRTDHFLAPSFRQNMRAVCRKTQSKCVVNEKVTYMYTKPASNCSMVIDLLMFVKMGIL